MPKYSTLSSFSGMTNYNSIVDAQTKADELLYEAKNRGRDKVIFDDGTVL